ncbi:T9SS type A sorting domain-containing protein [Cytophaga hutchinsonii]|uniref:CHU large protein uncharacterized n=1 Tax=Cytophaga hutchinsonii (strain ATCC 33406 / DSM 1761 / CIP 103989 / NBRC 15051 / NCIMB 9469 / D465) TaxID=269798 RepID=A0A6N4SVA4_CYTH3|nr:T9SS type A sorting domain-containing protein [Cytophaga hutchinsonii]ABG60345.1 CHU large protein; uncharacterized [Cytophaga hutchinsonii ATCC 33406]SFY03812.1 Por secretion system C-terminal sorting domain-containing protein [Cytophaga hutchinsonii ATCC 33406]
MKHTLTFWAKRCALMLLLSLSAAFVKAQAPIVVEQGFGPATVVITATTGSSDACITYANPTDQSNNIGQNKTFSIASITGLSGSITYSWSIEGGATIVGSTTGTSVTVKPTIQTNRFNKARLYLNYTGTKKESVPNPCPPYTGNIDVDVATAGQVFVDLYQKFEYIDPIVGEACIEKDKTYAFSIRDMVSGNINLGIGTDIYTWNTTSIDLVGNQPYASGDNSAIAFDFTSSINGGEQIFVQVGKCNSTSIAHTFGKNLPVAEYEIDNYLAGCIPTSVGQIHITNSMKTGIVYRWELGNSNYTFASGSNTNSQDGITVNIGTEGGTIYLYSKADPAGSDYCTSAASGEIVEVIQIKRSLDEGVTLSGPTCVHPGTYNYALTPNVNTPLNWELPYGWTIDGANQNASNVSITVAEDADFGVISISTTTCPGDEIDVNVYVRPDELGEISTANVCLTNGSTAEVVFSVDEVNHTTGYVWTLPAGWNFKSGTATDAAEITVIPNGTNGGTVSVYAQGNCANSNTASIEIKLTPTTPGTIARDPSGCINKGLEDVVTFTVTNDPNATSYTWDLGGSGTGSSTANSIVVTTSGTGGPYVVKVRANNSCGSSADRTSVVSFAGNGTVNITRTDLIIGGTKIGEKLEADIVASSTYQWFRDGVFITNGRAIDIFDPEDPTPHDYCVVVTSNTSGCITRTCIQSGYNFRVGSSDEANAKVTVYPNPAANNVNVGITNTFKSASITVYALNGAVVYKSATSNVITPVDLSQLENGMYFVAVDVDGDKTMHKVQVTK